MIKEHVLLPFAGALEEADMVLREQLSGARIDQIAAAIPEQWLVRADGPTTDSAAHRAAYAGYLQQRLSLSEMFVQEAIRARTA